MPDDIVFEEIIQKTRCSLFDFKPNRASAISTNIIPSISVIDIGQSAPLIDTDKTSLNSTKIDFEYVLYSYSEIEAFQEFFESMKGMNGSFCIPSWNSDLVMNQNSSTNTIVVKGDVVDVHQGQNLFFYIESGNDFYFTREVSSVLSVGGNTTITLTTTLPTTILAGQGISLVYRVTFDTDKLRINWEADGKAIINIGVIEERRETDQVSEDIDGGVS